MERENWRNKRMKKLQPLILISQSFRTVGEYRVILRVREIRIEL